MADDKYIVEFEDLFKEERQKRIEQKIEPERRNYYISSILVYFLTMFAISGLIYFFVSGFQTFQTTYTEQEALLETLIYDPNGLVLLSEVETYDSDYIQVIGNYQSYDIFVHKDNNAFDFLFVNGVLQIDVFESIMLHGRTLWDDGEPIVFYKGASQTFTFEFMIPLEDEQIISGFTTLSSFGLNVVNFSTYIILLPWVYFILKTDLWRDFKPFKQLGLQAVTLIITGYLLVIFGNLLSNALSSGLAFLFDYQMTEAANQLSIIRALNSRGMVLMLISAIIIGPIVEELIFRKAFFGLISNVKIAMIASSFTFGAVHLIGEASLLGALINGMSYIVMGFVFGYIYIRNQKNIWVPICVHILSNMIAILAILFVPM